MGPEPLGDRARVTAGKDAGRSKYVGELAHGTGNDVMDEGIYSSLTDIARAEGIDRAYVSRVFKLTRASPIIVEQALAGKVTMEALMAMGGCWKRQGVGQNITYSGMVHRRKPSLGSRMG